MDRMTLVGPQERLAGISLSSKIYAIGGDENETFSEVDMFDSYLGKWIGNQSKQTISFTDQASAPALSSSAPATMIFVYPQAPAHRRRGKR